MRAFGLFFLVFCSGCVVSHDTVSVLERSQNVPDWVLSSLKPADANSFFFVSKKDQIVSLPLGIRQAQAEALAKASRQVAKDLRQCYLNFWQTFSANEKDGRINNSLNHDFSFALDGLLSQPRFFPVRPKDLYWEQSAQETSGGVQTSYTVWVLVSVGRYDIERILVSVAKGLANEKNKEISKFGQKMLLDQQSSCEIFSH